MIQNLPRETTWHIRASRRLGISQEDVETVHQNVCLQGVFRGGGFVVLVYTDCEIGRTCCELLWVASAQAA